MRVNISIAEQALPLGSVFEFSLAKSLADMWNSGAKELAIFVAIFSGIWPYTKQLITLFLWFSPTWLTSASRRGSLLHWMDTLGKWSFVDIFVLVMSISAFRIQVESPNEIEFLPLQFYSIDILVVPCWGLYANMLAQIVSQLSSHFIIHYHGKTISACDDEVMQTDILDEKKVLWKTIFSQFDEKGKKRFAVTKKVNVVIVSFAITVATLFFSGCSINAFNLENFGLVGLLVESGQDLQPAYVSHSVFSIMKLMYDQARFTGTASDYFGLGVLSFIFVVTIFLVPLALLCLLMHRWFMPLDQKGRSRNSSCTNILLSWQYSEVFILSIVIASWQLAPISESFFNDYCGSLDVIFESLVLYNVIEVVDGQCYRVEASNNNGTWVLLAATLGLKALTHFVKKAAIQEETEDRSYPSQKSQCLEDEKVALLKNGLRKDIVPPANFTDYYRWVLRDAICVENSIDNEGYKLVESVTRSDSGKY